MHNRAYLTLYTALYFSPVSSRHAHIKVQLLELALKHCLGGAEGSPQLYEIDLPFEGAEGERVAKPTAKPDQARACLAEKTERLPAGVVTQVKERSMLRGAASE